MLFYLVWTQYVRAEPEPGGQHPQIGTHNQLVGSNGRMYLELIAPDPASAARSPLRAGIEQLTRRCSFRAFSKIVSESDHG
jgi:hypothetical protein